MEGEYLGRQIDKIPYVAFVLNQNHLGKKYQLLKI